MSGYDQIMLITLGYRLATLLIFGGVVLLCQPFTVELFSYGFPVLLGGVVLFMVLDHIPSRAAQELPRSDSHGTT